MTPIGLLAGFCIALLSLHFVDLGVKVKEKSLIGKKFKRKQMSLKETKHLNYAPCLCNKKMKLLVVPAKTDCTWIQNITDG